VIREGQVVLFRFPQTDQAPGTLRPALVVRRLPGPYDDWLVCMVSSQLRRAIPDLDELLREGDADYPASGLKMPSVIRICRLAVVHGSAFLGSIGEIAPGRLARLRNRLAAWIRT
jgi:mRNA interferase MazF